MFELNMDDGAPLSQIAAIQRAFSDAVDLFSSMDKTYQSQTDKKVAYALNMVSFRKKCRHSGDAEEFLFVTFLNRLFADSGYTIGTIGFDFDKHGKIADHDTLYIAIADYTKGSILKPFNILISKD